MAPWRRHGEQSVEFRLVEEPDLRIVVGGRRRLIHQLARVGVAPPLADRELEDRVEVDIQVADRLDGQVVEARIEEVHDVVLADLGDRLLSEVRDEVAADLRLVVGQRCVLLATPADQLTNPPVGNLLDRQPLGDRCRRGVRRRHGLQHPRLGLTLCQAVIGSGLPDRPKRAPNAVPPDVPLPYQRSSFW